MASDWLVWQVVDSAFPTGAFAHSWGLEAAWQQGEIQDRGALRGFLDAAIQQAGCAALPLATAAYRAPERVCELDALDDACLLNAVANRASRIQGRTLVATAARVWPSPALVRIQRDAASGTAHVAPFSGATFAALGLSLRTTQQVLLFATARGVLSAAVRLGIVGSYEAQQLQVECGEQLDDVLAACADLDERHLTQTAPILDLLQAGHDRLYSRLFQS